MEDFTKSLLEIPQLLDCVTLIVCIYLHKYISLARFTHRSKLWQALINSSLGIQLKFILVLLKFLFVFLSTQVIDNQINDVIVNAMKIFGIVSAFMTSV